MGWWVVVGGVGGGEHCDLPISTPNRVETKVLKNPKHSVLQPASGVVTAYGSEAAPFIPSSQSEGKGSAVQNKNKNKTKQKH